MSNLIDKAVGFFFPQRGLARVRARHAMRIYEGADQGRRGASWRSRRTSANAEIQMALIPMRDRARDLVRNTPHAPRLIDVLTSSIVGDGIRPVPNTGSDRLNDRVETLWNEWQREADVQGVHSFYSMQVLAIRSMIESGEVVLRFIDRNRKDVSGEVPLQLQILESDFIDSYRDGIYGMEQGGNMRSRLGVGMGDYDRRLGLWLFPVHPGEMVAWTALNIASYTSKFVGDDQLIHLFLQQRPGQVRGVTWFAPMLTTAREFADFMDAVTVKARVEACFSAFVTQSSDLENIFDPTATAYPADNTDGGDPNPPTITTLEPGTMKLLKPGQDIKFAQPTATSQIEPVLMFDLMAMAASVGATYDQLSGDLRGANYSSLRAGKLEFRARITQIQNLAIIPRLCERVWARFINRAIIAGALKERAGGYPCDWVTPAFQSVNPKFDQDAEEHSVRAGRMTPQEYFASWGNNWRKQLRDIADFYKYADELGVSLDIDTRKYTRAGSAQPVPKAPGAPGSAPGANGGGDMNGGGAQPVTLVDADGEPIDLSDFMDGRGGDVDTEEVIDGLIEMGAHLRDFDESEHPRDEQGKFTDAGGSDKETGGERPSGGGTGHQEAVHAKATASLAKAGGAKGGAKAGAAKAAKPGEFEHPGHGYSKEAYVDDAGVIHTGNVYDAARALYENRKVELNQQRQVSTLIEHLGKVAAEMAKMGKAAPTFDLCNVSVPGTNLFCAQSKGIPRVQMPQLDREQTKQFRSFLQPIAFRKYLKGEGYKLTKTTEKASYLRATQDQLNGAKVAANIEKFETKGGPRRIIVSRDNYILDGHHKWAAVLGIDARNNRIGDKDMDVTRVDISITKLLEEAEKFTGGKGKKAVGAGDRAEEEEEERLRSEPFRQ